MNRTLFFFMLTVVLASPVFAGGEHAGGHHDHGTHASVVGAPGNPTEVTRTVNVDLLDTMRFAFDSPIERVKQGEVVRFVVTNRGKLRHEFSIGSEAEQDAHREAMRKTPDMVHEDPNAVTVEPGDTKELIWRFAGTEPAVFACNIPGHAEAGMIATAKLGD